MSFEKPTKLEVAVHEAGHAYAFASLLEGEMPTEIAVSTDGGRGASGWSRRRTVLLPEVEYSGMSEDGRRHMIWQAEVETAIAIAGPLAEFRHRSRNRISATAAAMTIAGVSLQEGAFDIDGDFDRIRCSLKQVRDAEPEETLVSMIRVADVILASNWPKVRMLAHRLVKVDRLDARQIGRWFATYPAHPYDHPLRSSL